MPFHAYAAGVTDGQKMTGLGELGNMPSELGNKGG